MEGARTTLQVLAATLLAGLLLFGLSGLGATPAQAADPPSYLRITLTGIDPALPGPEDEITIGGTVTNTSKIRLWNLQAVFWRAPSDPILNQEALKRALTWDADEPLGKRVFQNFQNIPSETDRSLNPGESAAFKVSATVADLQVSLSDAVYLVGVHIMGRLTPDGPDQALGRSRVFLPLTTEDPPNTLQMTSLVVLASRPSLIGKSTFSDDHLATELGPSGRLTRLMRAARDDSASFAVDPELIQELRVMKAGYSIRNPGDPGTPTTGTGQSAAAGWLEHFDRLLVERDGYRMLYGNPDIAALVRAGQSGILTQADLAGRTVDGLGNLPLLVIPAGGAADAATLAAAAKLHPAAIVLADTSTGQTAPLLAGPKGIPVVNITSSAVGGGPGPGPSITPVHLQQRMLAETWLEATIAPAGSTLGRVRLVTSSAQAGGDDPAVRPPWIRRGTLDRLLHSPAARWNQKLGYGRTARAAELTPPQLRAIARLRQSYSDYLDLLVDSGEEKVTTGATLARASSAAWRRADRPMRTFLSPLQTDIDHTLGTAVEITTNHKVTTIAQNGVGFPITVRNTLPAPTEPDSNKNTVNSLQIEFTSDNAQRLTVRTVETKPIPAGADFPVTAQVRARANGTVRVVAQLKTESGRPVGAPVSIEVTVTQAGTTGWFIVLISGPVFVGAIALRIRQVTKDRAKQPPPAPVDDPLSSRPPTEPTTGSPDG